MVSVYFRCATTDLIAYTAEQVLLNKRQIYGGAPKVNCYQTNSCSMAQLRALQR